MSWSTFYQTAKWRKLRCQTRRRDQNQCQICGDRPGDPYCELQVHHRVPRSQGGPDTLENLITLCDLCHAVVTNRWHKPWFGEGAVWGRGLLEQARANFTWFALLDTPERARVQAGIWSQFGVQHASHHVEIADQTAVPSYIRAGADGRYRNRRR